jgi:hypothetical protein
MTAMTAMAATVLPPEMAATIAADSRRALSIEELCFTSAMSCFEGWLKLDPAIGPRTMAYVTKFISRTLEKTHNLKDVRYAGPQLTSSGACLMHSQGNTLKKRRGLDMAHKGLCRRYS